MSDLRLDLPLPTNGGLLLILAVTVAAIVLLGRAMRPKGAHWCARGHAHTSRESAEHCDHPDRQEVA